MALGPDGQDGLKQYLAAMWPLDPLAAFLLPRLSVAVGQNERSAFAFLGSGDPRSLRGWLGRNRQEPGTAALPTLGVDYLYDFFAATEFGAVLPRRTRQVLAQARVALEQLSDGDGTETRLIKVIAAISLVQDQTRLRPTFGAIAASLSSTPGAVIERSLRRLAQRKVIVHRQHSGEYALNPGSGVDLDLLLDKAFREADGPSAFRQGVADLWKFEHLVAHRITFEHGTTRSFAQSLVLPDGLEDEHRSELPTLETARTRPDGRIRYSLPIDEQQLEFLHQVAPSVSDELDILVVPEEPLAGLPRLATELSALRLLQGSSDMALDAAARHELSVRIEEAASALERTLAPLLDAGTATWYAGKTTAKPQSHRAVQSFLSDCAANAFSACPVLHNELVNRRELSSAAVVATKLVVERLLAGAREPNLGLSGNGPEVSITRAVLVGTTILRPTSDSSSWELSEPTQEEWKRVWGVIDQLVTDDGGENVRLDEVWRALATRPYGIRVGVLPLLTWAFLAANRDTVCLFERGTYIPVWSVELYDRMSRWPDQFALRKIATDDEGKTIISSLLEGLPASRPSNKGDEVPLNHFLRTLFEWYRALPEFAKTTTRLSEPARSLRSALNRAKDPVNLILKGIPEALAPVTPGTPDSTADKTPALAASLRMVCAELEDAYPQLLDGFTVRHASLLGVDPAVAEVRKEYQRLRVALGSYTLRPSAASFLVRAADVPLPDDEWSVSVASAVMGTPPTRWSDNEVSDFPNKLRPLATEILEAVATRIRLGDSSELLSDASRLAIYRRGAPVVDIVNHRPLTPAGERLLESLKSTVTTELSQVSVSDRRAVITRLAEVILNDHKAD